MTAIRRLVAVVLSWVAVEGTVFACPVCFQFDDSDVSAGVRIAVIVLMGVTAAVLIAVGTWLRRSGLLSADHDDHTRR